MYAHLNPWRAGLCGDDLDYEWMTHRAWVPGVDPVPLGIDPHAQLPVLGLFAQEDCRSRDELCEDYLAWLLWRRERDRLSLDGDEATIARSAAVMPDPRPGNRAWRECFGFAGRQPDPGRPQPDLRDFVETQLTRLGPGYRLEELRGSWLPRPAARCRRRVMRAAAVHGYPTGKIAELFNVSPATVSIAKYSDGEED